jgi:hypothetical protein
MRQTYVESFRESQKKHFSYKLQFRYARLCFVNLTFLYKNPMKIQFLGGTFIFQIYSWVNSVCHVRSTYIDLIVKEPEEAKLDLIVSGSSDMSTIINHYVNATKQSTYHHLRSVWN